VTHSGQPATVMDLQTVQLSCSDSFLRLVTEAVCLAFTGALFVLINGHIYLLGYFYRWPRANLA
jgi:hypothetical protein